MSNKRLKRTEAEFFVYEPGVVVPRDVTHILVHQSVKALPEYVFRDLRHLKEVVLPNGFREIGQWAFCDCKSLERIHFTSTLIRIGGCAFYGCSSLTMVTFLEGLTEIGDHAFYMCSSLKRITLSSTVTRIGDQAFNHCKSLEAAILVDGLRIIGGHAFQGCPLEYIDLPATLAETGWCAFESCGSLKMAKLSGGIQLIKRGAFSQCILLNHIRNTSKCLVVTRSRGNCNFNFVIDGSIPSTRYDQVVITSECFYSMRSAELCTLKIEITQILGRRLPFDRGWNNKRERLLALLVPHELRRKREVAGILELGLWKVEIQRSSMAGPGTRAACRLTSGTEVVIKKVLPFL